MLRKVIREVVVYAALLVILALVMHPDLLSDPGARFLLMQEKQNYLHPFVYTFIVYVFLFIIRMTVRKITLLLRKLRNKKQLNKT